MTDQKTLFPVSTGGKVRFFKSAAEALRGNAGDEHIFDLIRESSRPRQPEDATQPQVNASSVNSHTEAQKHAKTNAIVVPEFVLFRHIYGYQATGDLSSLPVADNQQVRVTFVHGHGGLEVFEGKAADCVFPEWFRNYNPCNHPPSHAA